MNIYFCDACGKRYTEETPVAPLSSPAAPRKNLCRECSAKAGSENAVTAVTESEVIIVQPAQPKARNSSARLGAARTPEKVESQQAGARKAPVSNRVIFGGAALAAIALLLAFVVNSSTPSQATLPQPAPPPVDAAAPRTSVDTQVISSVHADAPPKTSSSSSSGATSLATGVSTVAVKEPAGSGEAELKRVIEKLKALNPGFDGVETHKVSAGRVISLAMKSPSLVNLTPIHDLATLEELILQVSPASKLSDLRPLAGMKLTDFIINSASITDISPLQDLPLVNLNIAYSRVTDLSPIKNMHVKSLCLYCSAAQDLSPLAGTSVKLLLLHGSRVTNLAPIKALPLTSLDISSTKIVDLSALPGMPLTNLDFSRTPIKDLAPLNGMPLTRLCFTGCPVRDLTPLKSMPALADINLDVTTQEDLDFLRTLTKLKSINGKPARKFLDDWKPVAK